MSSITNYFPVTVQGYSSGHFLSRWDILCYPIMQCRCFSLCLVQGWLSIWVFRVFTQSRHGDCKEQTSKLHVPEGCNTREKAQKWPEIEHFGVNLTHHKKTFWFQEWRNTLFCLKMSGKMLWLCQKKKKVFGVFLGFFPKISTQRKSLDISALCSNVGWKQTLKCQDLLQDEFCQIFSVMPWPQNLHLTLKYGWMLRGWEGFCKRVSYVHKNLDTYAFQFLWCFRPFKDCS